MLVVGTGNPKKRLEILEIVGDFGLELRDLTHWPDAPEVVEDGLTFEDNARKKAVEVARYLHQWVLAEDSGLVVPALNGAPGVYSARYAGKQGDDDANNVLLLKEMAQVPDDRRQAYYVCVAALADPQGQVQAVTEGRCHGVILRELHGTGGFGYDPLFLVPALESTMAEIPLDQKNQLSHRAAAFRALAEAMRATPDLLG
jgi:XTP/dITP diphosphohydrolase